MLGEGEVVACGGSFVWRVSVAGVGSPSGLIGIEGERGGCLPCASWCGGGWSGWNDAVLVRYWGGREARLV